ncbi:MAG: apolipoprotein N-acyltransferase [Smithella sp.]|nr:apolipoprotein N-acyltransferase [Smithella sp.]
MFLSFPKFGSGLFAWVALIPLFFALRNAATVLQGFLLGFVTGIVGYIGIIYWIAYVIVNYGYLPLYVGILLMLILAAYLSLYVSLFAAGIVYFRGKMPVCLVAPFLWICFEYGKSYILTGFPWANLGYSQYANIYLIQFADVAGVFGISFLIILVNAALFDMITQKTKRTNIAAVVVFFVLAGVYLYGFCRVDQVNKAVEQSPALEVSLIQGNIDQSIKWDKNFQMETLNIYERLSLNNIPSPNSLIVWPETAVPFKFEEKSSMHDKITDLAANTQSWLITGSVSYTKRNSGNEYFNSAYLVSPSGDVMDRYDKVHLVPYGEYVPLRKLLPFVEGFTSSIGDFSSGKGFYPLTMNDKKIGVLICYEGILWNAARESKNHSAELLVNITNDAWFGDTSAPFQHFSMTVFRAVETRLYLVRAANTGISGIVDPMGRIIARTSIFQQDALKGNVRFVNVPTIYSRSGDILVAISYLMIILLFVVSLKGRVLWR